VVTGRMLEQLTYAQIGERLNVSSEGARAIVKAQPPAALARQRWPNLGCDRPRRAAEQTHARTVTTRPAMTNVVAALRIEQLEASLPLNNSVRPGTGGLRARAGARRPARRAQEILDIQLKNLRLLLQAERPAAAPGHCANGGAGCAGPADELHEIAKNAPPSCSGSSGPASPVTDYFLRYPPSIESIWEYARMAR